MGLGGEKKRNNKPKGSYLPTKWLEEMLFCQKWMFHFIKIPSAHGREMALSLDKLLLVGGFSPHLKNMLVKLEIIFPK